MSAKRSVVILFSVLLAVLLITSSVSARPLADALGTGFTYQGRLTDGGAPANGTYDFQFSLYNALSGGAQVGTTLTVSGVTVGNGLFTVQLDFGNVFDGTALWLQIAVRPGGGGSYTPLAPLQALSATPYALYTTKAGNADLLGGLASSAFAPATHNHWGETWTGSGTGLTLSGGDTGLSGSGSTYGVYGTGNDYGVRGDASSPGGSGIYGQAAGGSGNNYAGFFNGNVQINGSLGTTSTSLVTNLNADLLDGQHASAFAPAAQNLVIVAKSGGNFTTITAALNSITDASDTNRYLIYVAPGVYSERVTMKQYVDIEGAGELTTKITFTGSSSDNTGTLLGANNAELRFLTVENTGGTSVAIAIYNNNASPRLTHITASATGGIDQTYGVLNNPGSAVSMMNVTINASSENGNQYEVFNNGASTTILNSVIRGCLSYLCSSIYSWSGTVRIASSELDGNVGTDSDGGGTVTCAGVWDQNFNFFAYGCPMPE